jgi:hypothetical protein
VLQNVSGDARRKTEIRETLGSGAAAIDFDEDGLLDLFIANGDVLPGGVPDAEPRPALYRNLGGMRFEDVTERSGLLFRAWGHGASAVDFDADGHTDLFLTVSLGPNRFFRNLGNGTFEDVTESWGGADGGSSTAAAFFDADQDSDLDLYVGNYVVYDPDHPPNHGQPCHWRGLTVVCGPLGTTPMADVFYENRDGRLVEATAAFGFAAVAPSYTLGAVTGDVDNDGDTDLYVVNDSMPNQLFENLGGGQFRESALEHGVDRNEDGRVQAGMGVDCGDVDNDGRFDLFVTNFSHDTNTLHHNFAAGSGQTMFEDLTNSAILGLDSFRNLSWGTSIVDVDDDGWQDIVVVSGHVYPEVDDETTGTSYAQASQLYLSDGLDPSGSIHFHLFEPAPGDAFQKAVVGRGLVVADLDEDGDVDFLVVTLHDRPLLIRNDSTVSGHWIALRLRGTGLNREAIGARILIEDSRGVRRWRERSSGAGYLSSHDPRIRTGLGDAAGPARITVDWPGGGRSVYEGLEVDRTWVLDASRPDALPEG